MYIQPASPHVQHAATTTAAALQQRARSSSPRKPRFSRTHVQHAAPAPAAAFEPQPALKPTDTRPPTYARKPGDDVETPKWVLKCIEPVLSRSGATQAYDPFYSNGSASKSWAHLGWKCLHPSVDFFDTRLRPLLISPCTHFLVSQPPASLLPRLFKHDLRLIPRWAILVPSSFCLKPDVHAVGALSSITIGKPVSLCMNGIPVRSKRMTWLIKGVDIPGNSLHTNKGLWFWTLGKGDVFTRAQVADAHVALNLSAAVTLSPLDLTALRCELCELCSFFVEHASIAGAQSAARAICGKLRQSPVDQLGTSTVRKLLKCLVIGASLDTAVAEEVVACCEALTSTRESYILREVIRALPKLVSSHTPMLPR